MWTAGTEVNLRAESFRAVAVTCLSWTAVWVLHELHKHRSTRATSPFQSNPWHKHTLTHQSQGCFVRYKVNAAVGCKDRIFLCCQQFSLETLRVSLVVGICCLLNFKTCYENNSLYSTKKPPTKCKTMKDPPERITLVSTFYDTLKIIQVFFNKSLWSDSNDLVKLLQDRLDISLVKEEILFWTSLEL